MYWPSDAEIRASFGDAAGTRNIWRRVEQRTHALETPRSQSPKTSTQFGGYKAICGKCHIKADVRGVMLHTFALYSTDLEFHLKC